MCIAYHCVGIARIPVFIGANITYGKTQGQIRSRKFGVYLERSLDTRLVRHCNETCPEFRSVIILL